MKFIIRILFIAIISITPVAVYISNPFDVPTKNIRPRLLGHDVYRIPSKSMLPILAPGDYIIMSNIAYLKETPKRGDIIVFKRVSKKDNTKTIPYIKRVIAIARDTINIQQGVILINNEQLIEDYINPENTKRPYSQFQSKKTVPDRMIFVLGDNRDKSADSRIFGFVPVSDVIGQATTLIIGKNGRSWKGLKK